MVPATNRPGGNLAMDLHPIQSEMVLFQKVLLRLVALFYGNRVTRFVF